MKKQWMKRTPVEHNLCIFWVDLTNTSEEELVLSSLLTLEEDKVGHLGIRTHLVFL